MTIKQTEKDLEFLYNLSFIEKSSFATYRLHPLFKLFISQRFHDTSLYEKALQFYSKIQLDKKSSTRIEREIKTIEFLFEKCFSCAFYNTILIAWEHLQNILWERGYWILYRKIAEVVYQSSAYLENDNVKMNLCVNELAWCCLWQGEKDLAEKYVREGIKLATKSNNEFILACARQRLGKILQVKGNYSESLKESFSALEYFRSQKMSEKVCDTLPDIAGVYWAMSKEKQALHFLKEALSISYSLNDTRQQAYILIFFGCVHLSNKNYFQAEKAFRQSIKLERKNHKTPDVLFWANLGLGLVLKRKNDETETNHFFQKAKKQKEHLGMNKNVIYYRMFFTFLIDSLPEFLV